MFEFNIRFIGGLLSAYALSGDEVSDNNYNTMVMPAGIDTECKRDAEMR